MLGRLLLRTLAITILLSLMVTPSATAEMTVKLSWDASPSPDVAGYRLFARSYGGTYDYTNPIWEGPEVMTDENPAVVTVPGHSAFVCRAFDEDGNESVDSNETSTWEGPPEPPVGCRTGA